MVSSIRLPFLVPQCLRGTKEYKGGGRAGRREKERDRDQNGMITFFLQISIMEFYL